MSKDRKTIDIARQVIDDEVEALIGLKDYINENFEEILQNSLEVFSKADQLSLFAKLFARRIYEQSFSPKSKKIAADLLLLTNNFELTEYYWRSEDIRFGLVSGDFSNVRAKNETENIILDLDDTLKKAYEN